MCLFVFFLFFLDKQRLDNLVTLTTEESHLKLHSWTRGELGLHFKTHHDHALLLMQTSSDPVFGNKFTIKIVSGERVHGFGSVVDYKDFIIHCIATRLM